jgi:DNA-binding CsgD family transcriptional regulator/GAF domain-containing protein
VTSPFPFRSEEQPVVDSIRDTLASSLDLHEVMAAALPLLLRLVPADHAALGISRSGRPDDIDWIATQMNPQFFATYAEMVPDDFVLRAVRDAPNAVLRDSEMLARRDLESNGMYRRARELGMPLEHVMGVLLHADASSLGGLAIYRSARRPFSERDRAVLQALTTPFLHAVRNCEAFAAARWRGSVLERIAGERRAAVVLAPPARELLRTAAATKLLTRWFSSSESTRGNLPDALLERLREWSRQPERPARPLTRVRGDEELVVRAYCMNPAGKGHWILELEEVSRTVRVPARWCERLTPREREVTERVLRGWDNLLVAQDLECARDTVKQHLKHVYDKLGVSTRAQLIALARESSRG